MIQAPDVAVPEREPASCEAGGITITVEPILESTVGLSLHPLMQQAGIRKSSLKPPAPILGGSGEVRAGLDPSRSLALEGRKSPVHREVPELLDPGIPDSANSYCVQRR